VVVGLIIGSGIFREPAAIAADVGSISGVAVVWILGGFIMLCGGLSLGELAAAFPASGGLFVYLRETYGPGVAFLYGWTGFFLAPAATAGVALVFAEYLGTIARLSPRGEHMAAAAAILIAAAAGYRSVRGAGAIVSAASAAKVAALVALVVVAFALGDGGTGTFGRGAPPMGDSHWAGVGLGLVAVLWAYNGIEDMVLLGGEVRDPGRVLPRALLAGSAIVIAVYLLANAAYFYVLPYGVLRSSPLVASAAMVHVLGPIGAGLVAAMVMISTFGTVNAILLSSPRIFYAMAAEGLFFAPLARVHPRFNTPHVSVVSFAAVAVVCVWWGSFEQLTDAFVLDIFPFVALAAAGVLVLRRTRPDLQRPYRTPGYPVVPLVFIVGILTVVISGLVARPVATLAGMGLVMLGIPVYWIWRAQRSAHPWRVRVAGLEKSV
jgi:amino acid transporter